MQLFKRSNDASLIDALMKSQAVIEFTPNGTIVTANPNFLNAMGYTLEEVAGQHHSMFVEQEYAQSPEYAQFWQGLADGHFQQAEFKRIAKGGKEIWIQATYTPVLGKGGKVQKVVKFATDNHAAEADKCRLRRPVVGDRQVSGRHRIRTRRHDHQGQRQFSRRHGVQPRRSRRKASLHIRGPLPNSRARHTGPSGPACTTASSSPASSGASPRAARKSGFRQATTRSAT